MKAQLKSSTGMDEEEAAIMFQAVVDIQKAIAAKRAAHQPELPA